jgi:hypothetical protein
MKLLHHCQTSIGGRFLLVTRWGTLIFGTLICRLDRARRRGSRGSRGSESHLAPSIQYFPREIIKLFHHCQTSIGGRFLLVSTSLREYIHTKTRKTPYFCSGDRYANRLSAVRFRGGRPYNFRICFKVARLSA